jgi:hypothetical protein
MNAHKKAKFLKSIITPVQQIPQTFTQGAKELRRAGDFFPFVIIFF